MPLNQVLAAPSVQPHLRRLFTLLFLLSSDPQKWSKAEEEGRGGSRTHARTHYTSPPLPASGVRLEDQYRDGDGVGTGWGWRSRTEASLSQGYRMNNYEAAWVGEGKRTLRNIKSRNRGPAKPVKNLHVVSGLSPLPHPAPNLL